MLFRSGLGTQNLLAANVYGIAFTVNYDKEVVDSATMFVKFTPSWLGVKNTDMITLQKDFYSQGKIEIAMVRTNKINRTDYGTIGELNADMKDDLSGRDYIYKTLHLSFSNVRMITNDGTILPVNVINDSLVLVEDITGIKNANQILDAITIFPNPAKDEVYIDLGKISSTVKSICITNYLGQEMYCNENISQSVISVNTKNFASGVYTVQFKTNKGIVAKKLSVVN